MAGVKISALPAGIVPVAADALPVAQAGATVQVSASQLRQYIGAGLSNASTAAVAAAYAADTYLAGSAITIPTAGAWKALTQYALRFDMTKTAAGVATPIITVRMGTLGTTGDAAILVFTFGAGTAAIDTAAFEVHVHFRTVGAGVAAVLSGKSKCVHNLAGTGMTSTGTGGVGVLVGTSAGFNSTTQTIIGISFNGGAAFSGTNTMVEAGLLGN